MASMAAWTSAESVSQGEGEACWTSTVWNPFREPSGAVSQKVTVVWKVARVVLVISRVFIVWVDDKKAAWGVLGVACFVVYD